MVAFVSNRAIIQYDGTRFSPCGTRVSFPALREIWIMAPFIKGVVETLLVATSFPGDALGDVSGVQTVREVLLILWRACWTESWTRLSSALVVGILAGIAVFAMPNSPLFHWWGFEADVRL